MWEVCESWIANALSRRCKWLGVRRADPLHPRDRIIVLILETWKMLAINIF